MGWEEGWRHFWHALRERFVVQNEQLLRRLYDDRIQTANETVDGLRSIAIKLGLTMDGSDVREKFIQGLWEKQVKTRVETVAPELEGIGRMGHGLRN